MPGQAMKKVGVLLDIGNIDEKQSGKPKLNFAKYF